MGIFEEAKMDEKNYKLYDFMWGHKEELKDDIVETAIEDGKKTTYRFKGELGECGELLEEKFKLDGKEFYPKFIQACGGDGNEKNKITILHSSSLCALLFFYNVSKNNPVRLKIDEKEIVFDWVTFEFKNPVINKASNMDVVLVSDDCKHVLFLESKFSEYYMGASKKSNAISMAYCDKNRYSYPLYQAEILKELGIVRNDKESNFTLTATSDVYLDGIKQMISHYVGIRRRIDEDGIAADSNNPNASVILGAIKKGAKIYLGEILFDFENTIGAEMKEETEELKKVAHAYRKKYEALTDNMNKLIEDKDRFEVINKNFNYSDLKGGHIVDQAVLKYYNL